MAETVFENILNEIKRVANLFFMYCGFLTLYLPHGPDQLTMIILYVNTKGLTIERFIKCIPNIGHKAVDMLFQKYVIILWIAVQRKIL